MKTITPDEILDALKWRYATKAFDPNRKIPAGVWQGLERALVLSPSSYGLQPYRFLVITDRALREKLVPHSWGQRQVADASHFVVFLARTSVKAEHVEEFIRRIATVRGIAPESLTGYRDVILGDVVNGPRSGIAAHWAARQAYIALGNLLTSAALLGVDACPMEGFSPADYDEVLGLKGSGFTAVVAAALGYRSATDKYASLPKVRLPESQLLQRI
jgi:nitroreductase